MEFEIIQKKNGDKMKLKYICENSKCKHTTKREQLAEVFREMACCDDCLTMKAHGEIPAVCQYHLDKQFEVSE